MRRRIDSSSSTTRRVAMRASFAFSVGVNFSGSSCVSFCVMAVSVPLSNELSCIVFQYPRIAAARAAVEHISHFANQDFFGERLVEKECARLQHAMPRNEAVCIT